MAAVMGSVDAVKQVGGDTASATKVSVLAAIKAAGDIGSDAVSTVKEALGAGVDGAKEIIAAVKGEEETT